MLQDSDYLHQAIRIAMNGRGKVEPNPMVGCVLVKDHRVIGQGWHLHWGGAHAEPTALASVQESPAGATAYVTLEPCCHTDKKTPPCAPRLIEAGISRVVVGCLDPNPKVNGKGIEMLRAAGVRVDGPLLEAECKQLIAPFLASTLHHRPYITLKWAQSSNGLIAARLGAPVRITNEQSDRQVHLLRSRCDAIAVGTNTVLNDDPLLTARNVETPRPLRRVIFSNSLKFPSDAGLVRTAMQHPLIVYCSESSITANRQKVHDLRNAGVEVIGLPDQEGHFSFPAAMSDLHQRNVAHLLIEPGPTLARAMIERSQADRIWVFRSPRPIEVPDHDAPLRAPKIDYPSTATLHLGDDELTEYLNPSSNAYYASVPSADIVLAMHD